MNASFDVKLFPGAVYNSYQMNVYAQIYDNDGAYTIYDLPQPNIVIPDESNIVSVMDNLHSQEPIFETNLILNEGSILASAQEIQIISSILNIQSLSNKLSLVLARDSPIFTQKFGPMSNYSGIMPVI